MTHTAFSELLRKEMMVAMGCTEPAAAALAGAKACQLLGEGVRRIEIHASRDMVKNAMGVGLPNCSLRGIQAAVALGASGGNVADGLAILAEISEAQKTEAIRMASEHLVSLTLASDVPPLYIKVVAVGQDHAASAVIAGQHDRFAYLSKDDAVITDLPLDPDGVSEKEDGSAVLASLSLQDIVDYALAVDVAAIDFVLQGAMTNLAVAEHALTTDYGLSVGRVMREGLSDVPQTVQEALGTGAAYAAAASDARMAGCPLPVVINSGSGNQGITVSVPLVILARFLDAPQERLVRALCISQLVALVLTAGKDRLSALCGAFTAAIGTSCGMVHLLGGDVEAMDRAVNNMVANLTGIICDGAKSTCALKIYSCVEAAALSCRLALRGHSPKDESGIVGKDALQSFIHLSRISHEGMEQTDKTILQIMLDKHEACLR